MQKHCFHYEWTLAVSEMSATTQKCLKFLISAWQHGVDNVKRVMFACHFCPVSIIVFTRYGGLKLQYIIPRSFQLWIYVIILGSQLEYLRTKWRPIVNWVFRYSFWYSLQFCYKFTAGSFQKTNCIMVANNYQRLKHDPIFNIIFLILVFNPLENTACSKRIPPIFRQKRPNYWYFQSWNDLLLGWKYL